MSHTPTEEQAAVRSAFTAGHGLVVEAGAGTGKTSTLKLCAAATPRRRGIYVAYNRPLKDEAAKSFPAQVRAYTTHGLAFRPVATRYLNAGRVIRGPFQTARQVAEILRINDPVHLGEDFAPLAPTQLARLATQTVERFCKSGSEQLEPWHVPTLPGLEEKSVRADLRRAVLPYARRAWADLLNLRGRLRLVDNHYLKMFQLSHPRLRADYALVDESQDLNPCVAALMAEQDHLQVVYVGDSCQAINGWNGAVNAMADAPGQRLYLSQSFRFGPAIAAEANQWLGLLGARLHLRGFEAIASRVGPLVAPEAILCRTNAEAIRQAGIVADQGRRAALVGGGEDIKRLATAAIELRTSGSTGHPELCAFRSWAEVQDYVQQDAAGADLKVAVSLIETYGPDGVVRLVDGLVDEAHADVVLSTAHKAKGREWPTVRVAEDFREPRATPGTPFPEIPREDMMLAYVAVTRAQRDLDRTGLAWVDAWVRPAAPAPRAESRLAQAVREHPEAILPDAPDPFRLPDPGPVAAEEIELAQQASRPWAPALRRGCIGCGHTTIAHPRRAGARPCGISGCGCTALAESGRAA